MNKKIVSAVSLILASLSSNVAFASGETKLRCNVADTSGTPISADFTKGSDVEIFLDYRQLQQNTVSYVVMKSGTSPAKIETIGQAMAAFDLVFRLRKLDYAPTKTRIVMARSLGGEQVGDRIEMKMYGAGGSSSALLNCLVTEYKQQGF